MKGGKRQEKSNQRNKGAQMQQPKGQKKSQEKRGNTMKDMSRSEKHKTSRLKNNLDSYMQRRDFNENV